MNQSSNLDLGVWLETEALAVLPESDELLAVEKLSENSRTVYLIWILLGEIGNGGTEQYFFNVGHMVRATLEALKGIGAKKSEVLLAELAACYPKGFPSHDIEESRQEYEALPQSFFDLCAEFDQFAMGDQSNDYKLEENLAELVYQHVNGRQ